MSSIRLRTIIFILAAQVLINIFSVYYIYEHTKSEIEELFDAEQAQLAKTIQQLVIDTTATVRYGRLETHTTQDQSGKVFDLAHPYERKIAYQAWNENDEILIRSENAPEERLGGKESGFSRWKSGDSLWNVFSLYSEADKIHIYTAQSLTAREELIALITRDQLISSFVVNVLVLIIVVLGVLFGTRPIAQLNTALRKRDARNLKPIDFSIAKELQPIKDSINNLMQRLEAALNKERSFNEDLAHELRTPLAAIKIHAQTLELTGSDNNETNESISHIVAGIGIINDTIEQLIQLNKIGSGQNVLDKETVALHELAKEVLVYLPHSMHAKHDISLEASHCVLRGNRTLLGLMLRNLIENAVKYSNSGSEIIINVSQKDYFIILEVIDEGPGMTDQQKENSTRRHYRVSDSQAYGSGLGLSIVEKVADIHNAKLGFFDRTDRAGLIARVTFSKPAANI